MNKCTFVYKLNTCAVFISYIHYKMYTTEILWDDTSKIPIEVWIVSSSTPPYIHPTLEAMDLGPPIHHQPNQMGGCTPLCKALDVHPSGHPQHPARARWPKLFSDPWPYCHRPTVVSVLKRVELAHAALHFLPHIWHWVLEERGGKEMLWDPASL